jgi:hypothetical protein
VANFSHGFDHRRISFAIGAVASRVRGTVICLHQKKLSKAEQKQSLITADRWRSSAVHALSLA